MVCSFFPPTCKPKFDLWDLSILHLYFFPPICNQRSGFWSPIIAKIVGDELRNNSKWVYWFGAQCDDNIDCFCQLFLSEISRNLYSYLLKSKLCLLPPSSDYYMPSFFFMKWYCIYLHWWQLNFRFCLICFSQYLDD